MSIAIINLPEQLLAHISFNNPENLLKQPPRIIQLSLEALSGMNFEGKYSNQFQATKTVRKLWGKKDKLLADASTEAYRYLRNPKNDHLKNLLKKNHQAALEIASSMHGLVSYILLSRKIDPNQTFLTHISDEEINSILNFIIELEAKFQTKRPQQKTNKNHSLKERLQKSIKRRIDNLIGIKYADRRRDGTLTLKHFIEVSIIQLHIAQNYFIHGKHQRQNLTKKEQKVHDSIETVAKYPLYATIRATTHDYPEDIYTRRAEELLATKRFPRNQVHDSALITANQEVLGLVEQYLNFSSKTDPTQYKIFVSDLKELTYAVKYNNALSEEEKKNGKKLQFENAKKRPGAYITKVADNVGNGMSVHRPSQAVKFTGGDRTDIEGEIMQFPDTGYWFHDIDFLVNAGFKTSEIHLLFGRSTVHKINSQNSYLFDNYFGPHCIKRSAVFRDPDEVNRTKKETQKLIKTSVTPKT